MQIRAAVVREINQLTVEDVELDAPKPYELLVRIRAAGVCHSDLHTYRGELRAAPPLVLGHEGAGVVEKVGAAVTKFKPGDRILVNWLPSCLHCEACLRGQSNLCERFPSTTLIGLLPDGTTRLHTLDGMPLKHYLSSATMAEYAVIDEAGAIAIPDDVPFEVGALIGCAVVTGAGAVLNTAHAEAGSSAAVIGCGGVGLSAIMGAKLVGCNPIIAVDVMESKLAFARQMGATHTINAREVDAIETLRSMTRGGPDYVFDSVGAAGTINQALKAVRPGGTAIIIGMHAIKTDVPMAVGPLVAQNKRLLGSFFGSSRPHVDLPRLTELYRSGRLPLDDLITKRYALDELPEAFADMEAGHVARGIIMF